MDGEIRAEFDRIHDEDKRQNVRIASLEEGQKNLADLTLSVKELAINTKFMAEKVNKIDTRLAKIEAEPAEAVKDAKATAIRTAIAFIAGAFCVALGWLFVNHGGL